MGAAEELSVNDPWREAEDTDLAILSQFTGNRENHGSLANHRRRKMRAMGQALDCYRVGNYAELVLHHHRQKLRDQKCGCPNSCLMEFVPECHRGIREIMISELGGVIDENIDSAMCLEYLLLYGI